MPKSLARPFFAAAVLLALPLLLPAQQANANAAVKTTDQVFKNIQVFKGLPADELFPTMQFMANSLGVDCSFCHEANRSLDTKPQKREARKMIEMVFAANKSTFNGRPEINCYTCHQGHTEPNSNLSIAANMPASAQQADEGRGGERGGERGGPGRGRPAAVSAEAVMAKYIKALGGESAVAGIKSEVVSADRVMGKNTTPETLMRTGDKFIIADGANSKSGFNGTNYFDWNNRFGERTAGGTGLTQLQVDAGLYPAAGLSVKGARAFGPVPFNGGTADVLFMRSNGVFTRYYFDAKTGLLDRIDTGTPTFLGALPLQVDFSDYRTVDGVKLPFDVQFSNHEQTWERKINSIKLNAAVPDSAFNLPKGTGGGFGRGGRG